MGGLKKPKFFKDYKIPIYGTFIFVALVMSMLLIRYNQLNALKNFADKNELIRITDGQLSLLDDYVIESDGDNSTNYNQTDPGDNQIIQEEPDKTNTNDSGNNTSEDEGSPTDESESETPTDPEVKPPEEPAPEPFAARVKSLKLAFAQTAPGSRPDTCYGHYEFGGAIETFNGPGGVDYFWRHGIDNQVLFEGEHGHIDAKSGSNIYSVPPHIWDIYDKPSFQGWVQLVIKQPNSDAKKINFDHKCG